MFYVLSHKTVLWLLLFLLPWHRWLCFEAFEWSAGQLVARCSGRRMFVTLSNKSSHREPRKTQNNSHETTSWSLISGSESFWEFMFAVSRQTSPLIWKDIKQMFLTLNYGDSLWWISEYVSHLITLLSRGFIYDLFIYSLVIVSTLLSSTFVERSFHSYLSETSPVHCSIKGERLALGTNINIPLKKFMNFVINFKLRCFS